MMLVTYNQDFAEHWGGKVKDIVESRPDLFSYQLRADRSRVDRFETTTGSVCHFLGINGGQTGKDAGLIVIDDYIKGIKDAMSASTREEIWNSYVANIDSRVQNDTTVIIVATRWWSDDLIGRLLKAAPGEWEYICLPAIAKEGDPLGRKPGEVLFPEKQNLKTIERKRKLAEFSGVIFDALYQQEPVDDHSEFTNGAWIQVASGLDGTGMTMCRSWDFAATQGGGDFTTGTKMGRKGLSRQAFVFNIISKQLSPLKVEELIRATAVADGVECEIILEQEPGSQGAALIEHYKRNVLPEFKVIAAPAGNKSKFLKAQPFIASAQSGNVFFVDNSNSAEEPEWISMFRKQFGSFSPAQIGHDDQVDTAAMSYNHLFSQEASLLSWGREDASQSQVAFGIGSYGKLDPSLNSVYKEEGTGSELVTGSTW